MNTTPPLSVLLEPLANVARLSPFYYKGSLYVKAGDNTIYPIEDGVPSLTTRIEMEPSTDVWALGMVGNLGALAQLQESFQHDQSEFEGKLRKAEKDYEALTEWSYHDGIYTLHIQEGSNVVHLPVSISDYQSFAQLWDTIETILDGNDETAQKEEAASYTEFLNKTEGMFHDL